MAKSNSSFDLNNIAKAYLFTGEVDSRRMTAVNQLTAAVIDPGSEIFDLEKFDGDSTLAENILSAAMTMPFGSVRKVVLVDRIDKLNADGQSKIAAFLPKLGSQSCLVMLSGDENPTKRKSAQSSAKQQASQTENDEEEESGPKSKKGLQSVLVSAVKKHGVLISFDKLKAQDITTLVMQMARECGKKFEPTALQSFAHSMQSAPSIMGREMDKLATYVGERDLITSSDVELVTTKSPEDRVFTLIDAVAAGRADTAVHLLNETLAASTKPDGEASKVLALLGRHLRMLYQVKFLITQDGKRHLSNVSESLREMLMKDPNPLSLADWQRTKLLEQAHHFTLPELQRSLKAILSCELAVKGQSKASSSPRLSLEMLVIKLSERKGMLSRS